MPEAVLDIGELTRLEFESHLSNLRLKTLDKLSHFSQPEISHL